MKKLSLIVPFYNEVSVLKDRSQKIFTYCQKHFLSFELIFVDDGSVDGSGKFLHERFRHVKNVTIITHPHNIGRGAAITNGMKQATGDVVGYIDCDLEIKIEYVKKAIAFLDDYDIVIASKFAEGAKITTPKIRKISSILYNQITRIILFSQVRDHQAGCKLFRKKVVKALLPFMHQPGWLWDTEVLYLAQKKHYTIYELPITITYGFRKMRGSFFLDFCKLPFALMKLRRTIQTAFVETHE